MFLRVHVYTVTKFQNCFNFGLTFGHQTGDIQGVCGESHSQGYRVFGAYKFRDCSFELFVTFQGAQFTPETWTDFWGYSSKNESQAWTEFKRYSTKTKKVPHLGLLWEIPFLPIASTAASVQGPLYYNKMTRFNYQGEFEPNLVTLYPSTFILGVSQVVVTTQIDAFHRRVQHFRSPVMILGYAIPDVDLGRFLYKFYQIWSQIVLPRVFTSPAGTEHIGCWTTGLKRRKMFLV